MSHSYSSCLIHYVFSTKERRNLLFGDMRQRLYPYVGGIARENGLKMLAIGGTDNHVHILASLPPTMPVAKAIQLLKGGSSKWIHDTFPTAGSFSWQEGYGGFSISVSGIRDTIAYIQNQEVHHRSLSFEDEFLSILKRHGIEYDPSTVFG